MSQGRLNFRHPRAPAALATGVNAATLPDAAWAQRSIGPFRIGPSVLATAPQWHERGVQAECDGDLHAAIDAYLQALQTGGPVTQIVFDLAYALAATGKTAAAIERYRQVVELDPTRQDAWVNLGDLLLDAGEFEKGIGALEHALRLDPTDSAAEYNLADALEAAGSDRAMEHWKAFLAKATNITEQVWYARRRLSGLPLGPANDNGNVLQSARAGFRSRSGAVKADGGRPW